MTSKLKKLLTGMVVAVGVIVSVPAASAAAAPNFIEGDVVINGLSAANARVTVSCNGFAKDTRTSSGGFYSVSFSEAKCPKGASFNVSVKQGNKGGVTQGTVDNDGTTTANVTVTTVSVPEFGPIAAIGGVGMAAAGFWAVRRRSLASVPVNLA